MQTVFEIHRTWGWVALAMNGIAGIVALVAWKVPKVRGRWVWIATIVAEGAILLQVLLGVILVSSKEYQAPNFHMFYGYVAFIVVAGLFAYRREAWLKARSQLVYGAAGLFIMGLAIRAILQVE